MKQRVDETPICLNSKLTNYQFGKMANRQHGKLTKRRSTKKKRIKKRVFHQEFLWPKTFSLLGKKTSFGKSEQRKKSFVVGSSVANGVKLSFLRHTD
jgi:hypothetical protein